jgi:methionyl-tRNA formyltransferase
MGSDAIVLPLLDCLHEQSRKGSLELRAVVTQPDRPRGRGQKELPNAIKLWAREKEVEILQPINPDEALSEYLRREEISLILVMAYGHILRRPLLELPSLGCLNFHASLLPQLRGACPINAAIAEGLTETGVSLMRCVRRLDAGPVLDVERIPLTAEIDTPDLYAKTALACPILLERNLEKILSGKAKFMPQDESAATFTRILTKEDAALDYLQSARQLERRIRAMRPWPGSRLRLLLPENTPAVPAKNSEVVLKIGEARVVPSPPQTAPGDLCIDGQRLLLVCAEDALHLTKVQRPGGKMLPVNDFLRGFAIPPGSRVMHEHTPPIVR